MEKKNKTASLPPVRIEEEIKSELENFAYKKGTKVATLVREAVLRFLRDLRQNPDL